MEHLYQQYLDNLTAAFELRKPQVTADISHEEVLRSIRHNAEGLFHIHQNNDAILQEILFSKTAETLTAKEAENLQDLADTLFQFYRSMDIGIAHYIYRLLYDYAKFHGNIDLEIRALYHMGITLFYMNTVPSSVDNGMFTKKIGEYFSAGAAFLDRYEELQNPYTRSYIIRCLGNMKYSLSAKGNSSLDTFQEDWAQYMDFFSHTMDVLQSAHYRELNPEIPWDHYIYTMHYDRVKFLSGLRSHQDPAIAAAVMESADYIYQHQEQIARAKEKNVGVRTQYVYMAARYHAGLSTARELVDTLFRIIEGADRHDFSGDGIWAVLHCPLYLFHYSNLLPPDELESLQARLEQVKRNQLEFLFLLPQNEYANQVAQAIQAISGYIPKDHDGFSLRILGYILACHPPTFVHSRMVALLTRRICRQLLDKAPSLLNGAFGYEDAALHQEEIIQQAYESGLYHDLGKCMLLNYVGLYTRHLLDEEFFCIKLHTTLGCNLLNSLDMTDISDAAHYHHCAYDGNSGYPDHLASCPDRIRPIVDIITVADSLDAGTDDVGRSYAAAKTYAQIVKELRLGKGTRYAPYIVELFDDPEFYSEIESFIQENRRQVYLNAFLPSQKAEE